MVTIRMCFVVMVGLLEIASFGKTANLDNFGGSVQPMGVPVFELRTPKLPPVGGEKMQTVRSPVTLPRWLTTPRTEKSIIGVPVLATRTLLITTPPTILIPARPVPVIPTEGIGAAPGIPVLPPRTKAVTPTTNNHTASVSGNPTTLPEIDLTGIGVPVLYTKVFNVSAKPSRENTSVIMGLCGFPVYSNRDDCFNQDYFNDPLSQCEVKGGAIAFGVIIGILGILIISVNSLLPIVVWRSREMRTQYDYMKVSLAFADMILGFILLASVLPNITRFQKYSEKEAVEYITKDVNSPSAIVVGSLMVMSTQGSLLHLTFMSLERYIAIQWSFWHLRRKSSTIFTTLGSIWAVSFLCSFIPAAFPSHFEYIFQPTVLIHMMTIKSIPGLNGTTQLGYHGPLYASLVILLPYAITVISCILTGVVSYRKLSARRRKFGGGVAKISGAYEPSKSGTSSGGSTSVDTHKSAPRQQLKPEISVFITIVIMITVFTITLLPFTVVMVLFVLGVINCEDYTIPYVVSFYILLTNSFANAIIYTVRDRRFRSAVSDLLCSRTGKIKKQPPTRFTSHSTQL